MFGLVLSKYTHDGGAAVGICESVVCDRYSLTDSRPPLRHYTGNPFAVKARGLGLIVVSRVKVSLDSDKASFRVPSVRCG